MLYKIHDHFKSSGWLDINGNSIARFQRILDLVVISFIFFFLQPTVNWTQDFINIPSLYIVSIVTLFVLPYSGIYRSYRHKSLSRLFQKLNSTWLAIICLVILAFFLNKSSATHSRIAISLWAASGWIWLISSHILTRLYLRRIRKIGRNSRTILYWGESQAFLDFSYQLSSNPWLGYRILSWFSPENVDHIHQNPKLPICGGGFDQLKLWLDENVVDCIVFSHVPSTIHGSNQPNLFDLLGNTCSRILYAPHWCIDSMSFKSESIGYQNCIELWGLRQTYDERIIKRLFDLLISVAGVIVLFPLLLFISILVRFSSPGPVIFKQKRCGLQGKVFNCYKFRSMYVDPFVDTIPLKQAHKGDNRITPVGRLLRRWSLDELPQLFNVVIGDMSLVGPRPHALEHDEIYRKLITGYTQRYVCKPGMTGLAQVSGFRGETKELSAMEARVMADLEYQREWSLLLDIEILFSTFFTLVSSEAY
ncbi:undecaprenyl-phosphate glucose phosphotransferase [Synechococcus sp. A15-62]|uniref:exopolysaccharide biosynthesis polyprenyl glycosylphosphotransferase n=1 Tax=Synechococcus sp. A15-62 TaxID=1050657 RepID=UPI001861200E|nr:exopolysaccharide biosynthesis polyprenyl glycosylphosphotransferase [Synechococcus sp. A15-62]QNJ00602.1 undecaprenyl-phosphate glucose phosphotransferase [Synechococcus sp. A15-62]